MRCVNPRVGRLLYGDMSCEMWTGQVVADCVRMRDTLSAARSDLYDYVITPLQTLPSGGTGPTPVCPRTAWVARARFVPTGSVNVNSHPPSRHYRPIPCTICVVPRTHNGLGDCVERLPSYLRQDENYRHFTTSLERHMSRL